MLFIMTQQVQPAFIMEAMHSQQDWIMVQQALSPLVQVMHTPLSVISHLHMPIIRLQQQTVMPFIKTQQLHMPPASIVHRFWSMPAESLSSHLQVIFMPLGHFSNDKVQRGTITMFIAAGAVAGLPIMPADPGIPIPARSIIIALVIVFTRSSRSDTAPPGVQPIHDRPARRRILPAKPSDFKRSVEEYIRKPL
jgi:hypothetical protein